MIARMPSHEILTLIAVALYGAKKNTPTITIEVLIFHINDRLLIYRSHDALHETIECIFL